MKGEIDHEHPKFREYNETAIVLSAALRTHARVLFGPIRTPEKEESIKNKDSIKPVRPIDYNSDVELDCKIDRTFAKSAFPDIEESDPEELGFTDPFKILTEQEQQRTLAKDKEKFRDSEEWKSARVSVLGKHKPPRICGKLLPSTYLDPRGDCDIKVPGEVMFSDPNIPSPHEALVREELATTLEECFKTLDHREVDVIKCVYGIGKKATSTLGEIARIHDISCERVRQIEKKTRTKLKHPSYSRKLRVFLPDCE